MNNWKKLDDRALRISAKRIDLPKEALKNYRNMIKDLTEEDSGVYEVRCQCFCGRIHRHIVIIKEGMDWSRTYRKDRKNNHIPFSTCEICKTKAKQYKKMGMNEDTIKKMLGWKEVPTGGAG